MEEPKITLRQTLLIIINKLGNIRIPVREKELFAELDMIASDLYECIKALDMQEAKQEEKEEAADDGRD